MDPNTRHTTTKKLPSCRGEGWAVVRCTLELHTGKRCRSCSMWNIMHRRWRYSRIFPSLCFVSGLAAAAAAAAAVWAFYRRNSEHTWQTLTLMSRVLQDFLRVRLLYLTAPSAVTALRERCRTGPDIKMTSITLIVFSPVSRQSVFVLVPLGTQTLPNVSSVSRAPHVQRDSISPDSSERCRVGKKKIYIW